MLVKRLTNGLARSWQYVRQFESGLDGKANNGVFDVVAKLGMTGTEGVETARGTIRSGETFR
jgi:hypothetical protein